MNNVDLWYSCSSLVSISTYHKTARRLILLYSTFRSLNRKEELALRLSHLWRDSGGNTKLIWDVTHPKGSLSNGRERAAWYLSHWLISIAYRETKPKYYYKIFKTVFYTKPVNYLSAKENKKLSETPITSEIKW